MGDAYGEGTTGHGLGHDQPHIRDRYVVEADLDTVIDELVCSVDGLKERGYPVAGVYGPTPAMATPVAVRCYDAGEDAAMRIAHDTISEEGVYTSRVTLYADTAEQVVELQEQVDAVMAEFHPEEGGLLDRFLRSIRS